MYKKLILMDASVVIGLGLALLAILWAHWSSGHWHEEISYVGADIERGESTSFIIAKEYQTNLGSPMIKVEIFSFYNGYETPEGTKLKYRGNLKNGDKVYEFIEKRVLFEDNCMVVNANNEAYASTLCHAEKINTFPQPIKLQQTKIYREGSFTKEIIYSGKSGNTIKLIYREFKDDLARPSFYQDLSYDLTESKIIGFKNMKIDIIEATNSYIKFVVLSQ